MKSLITGGAGFIGSHLAELLLDAGHDVVVFDDLSTGRIENLAGVLHDPRFRFIEGNILDADALGCAIAGCDEVYHLAAMVGVKLILERPLESMRVNMEGTENVLRLAARHRRRVLFASSSEVYGNGAHEPLTEHLPRVYGGTHKFRWAYAGAKAMGESLALAYGAYCGLPAVIVRLFNVVGPRQQACHGMVLPTFIAQATSGAPISVYGSGEQSRCFVHVADVVGAMRGLMREPEAHGEIFNIGSTQKVTMAQLALLVKTLSRSSSAITPVPYDVAYPDGFEEIMQRVPDLEKIERAIGYRPRYDIEEIVREMIGQRVVVSS